jgi:D-amino-acid dehydrogenase
MKALVIGAGMVGLSTAWHLQRRGVEVTIVDRTGVAADASWGNAGWLAPALTLPLPEPAVLRYGLKALLDPSSPVYVPPSADPRLIRFLLGFARHCTTAKWNSAMGFFTEANRRALPAYDEFADGGVQAQTSVADPFMMGFTSEADREGLITEFRHVIEHGGEVDYELLSGEQIRSLEPTLGEGVRAGIRLRDQRFIDPPRYLAGLADAVRERGAEIIDGFEVEHVHPGSSAVSLTAADGRSMTADVAVIASGARLNRLARPFGVRTLVQAGRGYSFTVTPQSIPKNPIYFPVQRVACTPLEGRFRVAGMMEFRNVDAPLDPRRIRAIVDAARPMFTGIDWSAKQEEWVGSRPCTADGLPLIGATRSSRVFVGGGHGMWGIALGPLTGRLLADTITGGPADPLLAHCNPLR